MYGAGVRAGLGGNPGAQKATIGSQTVKKVQSDVHIDRKTFRVVGISHLQVRDKSDPTKLSVVFKYFAKGPSTLMVILACQEERQPNGSSVFKSSQGFPSATSYQIEGVDQEFPEGVIVVDMNLFSTESLITMR